MPIYRKVRSYLKECFLKRKKWHTTKPTYGSVQFAALNLRLLIQKSYTIATIVVAEVGGAANSTSETNKSPLSDLDDWVPN